MNGADNLNEARYDIHNPRWFQDEWGDYWVGELFCNGKQIGITGTYYSVDGKQRPTREEQDPDKKGE